MKKIIGFMCLACICFMPRAGYGIDFYNTVFVDGKASINVDGDLSDWDVVSLQLIPLGYYENLSQSLPLPQKDDLSASFKCFADEDYVYVGVIVNDDKVFLGNHPFGEGWNDDSVEICFDSDLSNVSKPYFDNNDGQVRVIGNYDGSSYLEGVVPYLYISQLPYYWEARGIRGGFKLNDRGYSVEVAIPLEVLELNKITPQRGLGVNIRVLEDDHEENNDENEGVLSWSFDPDKTSWWKTDRYNRVVFVKAVTLPGVVQEKSQASVKGIKNNAWEVELGLNAPDKIGFNNILISAFSDIANSNWKMAEEKLKPLQDRLWAQLIVGVVQFHDERYAEAITQLNDFAKKCPDDYAATWAYDFSYNFARELMLSKELFERFQKRENGKGALILHEYLKQNPGDPKSCELLSFALSKTKGSDVDFIAIQKVISEPVNQEITKQAQIALARYYFINNKFDNAQAICTNLLSSELNSTEALNTKMILLSIERKLSQK